MEKCEESTVNEGCIYRVWVLTLGGGIQCGRTHHPKEEIIQTFFLCFKYFLLRTSGSIFVRFLRIPRIVITLVVCHILLPRSRNMREFFRPSQSFI